MRGIGMNIDIIFKNFLKEAEQAVSENSYNLWFSTIEPISFLDDKFKAKVPMGVHRDMLSNNYIDLIDKIFFEITGKKIKIEYITEEEFKNDMANEDEKENSLDIKEEWSTNLNPSLTFDNFIVGKSNNLAVISAHKVAENPGKLHNPFFLYGKSGIGKTHLMHAIGNFIVQNSNKKVLYCTSNDFVNDYIGIAYTEKGNESINYAKNFKEKYQNVDVLLIDDIQFLVGADKSQQEFFYTFTALYNNQKQIIISSDKSPDDLKKIEERLRSRFISGLPVDIYPPDYELRCKIIKDNIKNTILEDKLKEEVIEYIANSCQNDVRFIKGTINRLMAYTAMMVPKKVDLDFAVEALKDYLSVNIYADNSISKIQKVVADYFNITVNDLKSKRKTADITKPRHIAIYLCREMSDEGLVKIGARFGGRDHSTIHASAEKISREIRNDEKLNAIVKEIKNKL